MNTLRFQGLHLVNMTGLTDHQHGMFGENYFFTRKSEKPGVKLKRSHYRPVFPTQKPLAPTNAGIIGVEYEGQTARAYYTDPGDERQFEQKLQTYIAAFERQYRVKLPHVFIPKVTALGGMYDDAINQLPGLKDACQKLFPKK